MPKYSDWRKERQEAFAGVTPAMFGVDDVPQELERHAPGLTITGGP
jgi:hypothetical protein